MKPEIFVIHCHELVQRTAACREHLREQRIDATWWRSFYGRAWGLETTLEFDLGQRISPGHVGLLLGHYSLWLHLTHLPPLPRIGPDFSVQTDSWVVFEDDVAIQPGFSSNLTAVQAELDRHFPQWDFVFLGLAEPDGPRVWNKITERVGPADGRLARLSWPWGTHAYMVRRRALPVLLDRMVGAERNMDQQLFLRVLKDNHLNWCAVIPSLVQQRTYDHKGIGKPEWAPSTINPGERGYSAAPINGMAEHEAKALCGAEIAAKPTPELMAATMQLVDPLPCIYKGEFLDEHGRGQLKKSIPVNQCARFDRPCHSLPTAKTGVVIWRETEYQRVGRIVLPCDTCETRTSMGEPADKRPRLPLPEGHFNPSIAMWQNRLVLATRDSWGHSKIALWHLDNLKADWTGEWKVTPIGAYGSSHPEAPRLEDPRLFVRRCPDSGRNRLCAALNCPDGYPPRLVQMGLVQFDENLTGIEHTEVYRSPAGSAYEKNWCPLVNEHGLSWVYGMKPEHVVMAEARPGKSVTPTYRTKNNLPWRGGVMRGGAVPVMHNGVWYSFFHGCLKRFQGSVYSMGVYTFSPEPPYKILRQTPVPLLWPDVPGVGEDVVKRFVIWPGGAVPHAGAWHIAVGVDDTYVRMVRFPFEQVDAALSDVPEASVDVSIRDTPLALGTPLSEMDALR